jgi:hypothetical protein
MEAILSHHKGMSWRPTAMVAVQRLYETKLANGDGETDRGQYYHLTALYRCLLRKFTLPGCLLHKLTLLQILAISVHKYNCHVSLSLLSLIYCSFLITGSPLKRSLICNELYLSIYLCMALQPFVGPWPLFHFLDLLQSQ